MSHPDYAYWPPEDPRWATVLVKRPDNVPDDWCPGGDDCTCCYPGCDCGCRDDCPVWKAKQKYVTAGQYPAERK